VRGQNAKSPEVLGWHSIYSLAFYQSEDLLEENPEGGRATAACACHRLESPLRPSLEKHLFTPSLNYTLETRFLARLCEPVYNINVLGFAQRWAFA
jgi:hypothetical protein